LRQLKAGANKKKDVGRGKSTGRTKSPSAADKTQAEKENKILVPGKRRLIVDLIKADCFQLGKFTLKSGLTSPFYLDLRLVISHPGLMQQVAGAYCSIIKDLKFDRLAGIPFAAIPFTSIISLMLDKPLIFPRLEVKEHGTKKQIEGRFQSGEQVLLVDDLISTGASKLEAVNILRGNGLKVSELVVLVERGLKCRAELEAQGIRLHAYLHIYDFLDVALELQKLTAEGYDEIIRFLES
jgi:uridine monophosphate synthetase